jgi:hypothetical protein
MNALLIIGLIWVFIALIVGITFAIHRGQVYYGDTEYCSFCLNLNAIY